MTEYKPGDKVECAHSVEWQNEHRDRDIAKARKLGRRRFLGNAAAYMHLDEAYVVERVTETGGLKLRGFTVAVSPKDVRHSDKPVIR